MFEMHGGVMHACAVERCQMELKIVAGSDVVAVEKAGCAVAETNSNSASRWS